MSLSLADVMRRAVEMQHDTALRCGDALFGRKEGGMINCVCAPIGSGRNRCAAKTERSTGEYTAFVYECSRPSQHTGPHVACYPTSALDSQHVMHRWDQTAPSLPTFDAFLAALRPRLEAGARTYGDASFDKPLPSTLGEIEQELLDVAGWAYVAWVRFKTVIEKLDLGGSK